MQQARTLLIDRQLVEYRAHHQDRPDTWLTFERQLNLSWLFHDFGLEGIALTEGDIGAALSEKTGDNHADKLRFEQIRRVMTAISASCHDARRGRTPITLADIKALHAALVPVDHPGGGRYRKHEPRGLAYHHSISKPATVSYHLRKLVHAMDGDYKAMHPVRAAGLIHHDFMFAWPFATQSGPVGRLLMNLWLMRAGYPPAIVHAKDRHAYYDGLASDPSATVELVTDAMITTLRCAETLLGRAQRSHLVG